MILISEVFCWALTAGKFRAPSDVGENAYAVICDTHSGIDIVEPLADRRCCRRPSCSQPYFVSFGGRARGGRYSPTWLPRFRLECELLGFPARPSGGFGSRADQDRSQLSLQQPNSEWRFFCRWGAPAPDREREGSDLETMGRAADAGNERRGAERQEATSLCRPVALLAWGRAWPTSFSPTHVFPPDAERSLDDMGARPNGCAASISPTSIRKM